MTFLSLLWFVLFLASLSQHNLGRIPPRPLRMWKFVSGNKEKEEKEKKALVPECCSDLIHVETTVVSKGAVEDEVEQNSYILECVDEIQNDIGNEGNGRRDDLPRKRSGCSTEKRILLFTAEHIYQVSAGSFRPSFFCHHLWSSTKTRQSGLVFLWEGQQQLLDLQVPVRAPLCLACKAGQAQLDRLQDLVQVSVQNWGELHELGLLSEDGLQGGCDIALIHIRLVTIHLRLELSNQLLHNAGLDHGHEVADRWRVATNKVHVVAVGHLPEDSLGGLCHSVGLVAVALELRLVRKDAGEDSLEEGTGPDLSSLRDRVGDGLNSGGGLVGGQGVLWQAIEDRVLDFFVEKCEVFVGEDLVLV